MVVLAFREITGILTNATLASVGSLRTLTPDFTYEPKLFLVIVIYLSNFTFLNTAWTNYNQEHFSVTKLRKDFIFTLLIYEPGDSKKKKKNSL